MSNAQRSTGHGRAPSTAKERMWRQHVSRHGRSKLTVRDYCAQAGISEPSFYAWRSELARRDSVNGRIARSEPTAPRRAVTATPRFVPIAIAPPVASHVEVVLRSGLVIRVPAHDTAALRTVLELLEPRPC
jgi:hypothetical protein